MGDEPILKGRNFGESGSLSRLIPESNGGEEIVPFLKARYECVLLKIIYAALMLYRDHKRFLKGNWVLNVPAIGCPSIVYIKSFPDANPMIGLIEGAEAPSIVEIILRSCALNGRDFLTVYVKAVISFPKPTGLVHLDGENRAHIESFPLRFQYEIILSFSRRDIPAYIGRGSRGYREGGI